MFEFVYRKPSTLRDDTLNQGDIVARTPEVMEAVGQAHQYYADAPLYTHFVVITQSCDLVRRRGDFNAPYITIAAAKPFRRAVSDILEARKRKLSGSEFEFFSRNEKSKSQQLLERFLNNTESEYFFLPHAGHPNLHEDLLVHLRLSIALRKDHYEVLAKSKLAELDDIFQAKLGWLKGNIYSRVGTPDFSDHETNPRKVKDDFFNTYIPTDNTIWLSVTQADKLRKLVARQKKDLGRDLNVAEVLNIIEDEIHADIEILAENIVDRLVRNKIVDPNNEKELKLAKNSIVNDSTLKSILGRAG